MFVGLEVVERLTERLPTNKFSFLCVLCGSAVNANNSLLSLITATSRVPAHPELPDTLFYLDPCYYGWENCYGDGIFSKEDFGKLRSILDGLKGKFILSINDRPEMRETFKGIRITKEKTTYGTHPGRKAVTDLLISNF